MRQTFTLSQHDTETLCHGKSNAGQSSFSGPFSRGRVLCTSSKMSSAIALD